MLIPVVLMSPEDDKNDDESLPNEEGSSSRV